MHLIRKGSGKLVINCINKIGGLWLLVDSFHATNLAQSVTVYSNDADTSVSQNLQFKEQYKSLNLGDCSDKILHHLKLKNLNRLAVGHLNINSLSNKFGTSQLLLKNSLDIFMISKTMFAKTFPEG